jgi:hypothetical protein
MAEGSNRKKRGMTPAVNVSLSAAESPFESDRRLESHEISQGHGARRLPNSYNCHCAFLSALALVEARETTRRIHEVQVKFRETKIRFGNSQTLVRVIVPSERTLILPPGTITEDS